MGRVASCGKDGCQGTLAPLFDKDKEQQGYYCERCGTVFEDVETVDGIPHGVKPLGRITEQEEIREREAKFEAIIDQQRGMLDSIYDLVEGNKTDLGKLIKAKIEELRVAS